MLTHPPTHPPTYLQLVLDDAPVQQPIKGIQQLEAARDSRTIIESKGNERSEATIELLDLFLEAGVVQLGWVGGWVGGLEERALTLITR